MTSEHRPALPTWLGVLVFMGVAVNLYIVVVSSGPQPEIRSAHVARPLITSLREQGADEEVRRRVTRAIIDAGDREKRASRRAILAAALSSLVLVLTWEIASRRLKMPRVIGVGSVASGTAEQTDGNC